VASTEEVAGSRPLVIDGLNCAVVTRDQFERTLKGGVSIINLTAITPWSSVTGALKELEANLATIEAMSDIACVVRTVDDIHAAKRDGKLGVIVGSQSSQMAEEDLACLRPSSVSACVSCSQPTTSVASSARARRSLAMPTKA
jgi:microsomal dipeptidase-like Zn-dependent dipeptidase